MIPDRWDITMEDNLALLDTPKRNSLESHSTHLRTILKDYERNFATKNGRKPGKDDIKTDATIAKKYKEYTQIHDILSGKLSVTALNAQKSPKRKRDGRHEDGIVFTPTKKVQKGLSGHDEIRSNNSPVSESPTPTYLYAIAPTPHRDGKVFGLLDMLSTPGSSRTVKTTPRKVEGMTSYDASPRKLIGSNVAQTPNQRSKKTGDILDHLTGTPPQTLLATQRKHSRTPASDGKKFLLSQFFATPSAVRYSRIGDQENEKSVLRTPLRDVVLGLACNDDKENEGGDATPRYLKRSASFKDRLLSAAKGENVTTSGATKVQHGPPTLRHFRSSTNVMNIYSTTNEADEDEHEDDLDALRELENDDLNVLTSDDEDKDTQAVGAENVFTKPYKKKGQKRTTRRAIMRPVVTQSHEAPKYVVDDSNDEDDSDDISNDQAQSRRVKETAGDESEDFEHESVTEDENHKASSHPSRARKEAKIKTRKNGKEVKEVGRKSGTINPNAQSHMNYRSLKIKNKNSKAKRAGGARFGRGRR